MIEIIIQLIILIVGFLFLIKGADYFVDGASSIANVLKVPTLIIGLTVVAFGTSAPEAAVSVAAAIDGSNAIAISNIVGSNIFNILFILGLSGLIHPINVGPSMLIDLIVMLIATFALYIFSAGDRELDRKEGIIFIVMFLIYMAFIIIRN
jgi:cation:H+ antiporter